MRLTRWAARLLCYNFEVKYKKGDTNIVADTLSRMPLPDMVSGNVADEAAIYAIMTENLDLPGEPESSADILAKATQEDAVLSRVLELIGNN